MNQAPRLALCATACVILFVTFGNLFAEWLGSEDLFGIDMNGLSQTLLREYRRRDELDAKDEVMRQKLEAKKEVIHAVVAGRVSLPEAVEQFRELNEKTFEEGNEPWIATVSPPSDEMLGRQIVDWASALLEDSSAQADVIRCSLEQEWKRNFSSPAAKVGSAK